MPLGREEEEEAEVMVCWWGVRVVVLLVADVKAKR